MRQVFSSPRIENVERLAQMLRDAGIEVRVTHGRSYRGGLRGNFTYRDNAREGPVPAVWVVFSEDQPRARALLREQGLLDSTRGDTGYRLPAFRSEEPVAADDPGRKRAFRLKIGLLLVIAVVLGLTLFALPEPSAPAAPVPAMLAAGVSPTPDALALAVLAGELPKRAEQALCLSVDGNDPSPALLAALPATPGQVFALSQCPAASVPRLAIIDYRAHAPSGAGSISLSRTANANAVARINTYEVSHGARGWRVVELL